MLTRNEQRFLQANAKDLANLAVRLTREEIEIQGHVNTGRLRDSVDSMIVSFFGGYGIDLCIEDYGLILNAGVKPNRIPYSRGSGKGTSKYIQGLIQYFKQKGLGNKEAKSAAFATANKHKMEGLPTRKSSRFSRNGKRTEFLDDAILKIEKQALPILENNIDNFLEFTLFNRLNTIAKSFAA